MPPHVALLPDIPKISQASHELEPDLILDEVLQYYGDEERRPRSGTKEKRNRDLTLEVVSDSGVVAGLVRTANLHSRSNPQSWMYVFTHPRSPRDHSFNVSIFILNWGSELGLRVGSSLRYFQ